MTELFEKSINREYRGNDYDIKISYSVPYSVDSSSTKNVCTIKGRFGTEISELFTTEILEDILKKNGIKFIKETVEKVERERPTPSVGGKCSWGIH